MALNELSDKEVTLLMYDWEGVWAREKQLLPEWDWETWLLLTGRGFGKTRTGAEAIRIWKDNYPIIHLVGATAGDVRDIMIEGESGILQISPPDDKPLYEPSKRRLTWNNGAKAILFSADEPDRLRGPQCYKAWGDELASWRYPDAWDQLQLGLRLGDKPQVIVTTTPRPTKIIKEMVADPTTHVTSGNTYENKSNLSKSFIRTIERRYGGTRIGSQEIEGNILEDVEGALWTQALIDNNRVKKCPENFQRIIIAIDPATTSKKESDETGIIVGGLGFDGFCYILEDLSGRYTPNQWAGIAISAYVRWRADRVVAEVNQGGDMVETIIKNIDPAVSYSPVTAFRGKALRAEPVVHQYEQGYVKHVGVFPELETQMTTWIPDEGRSPDRVDAAVYVVTFLKVERKIIPRVRCA